MIICYLFLNIYFYNIEPGIIPINFKIDKYIDYRTAKFSWDQILLEQAIDPASGMKGRLAGFIVNILY